MNNLPAQESLEKLDKTDLKILHILQENSKITNLDLSKKIGLSPAPTLERVKKLYADEATTLTNLQDATTGFDVAKQSVQVAEFNQKLSRIYSPKSGRILRKISEQGELITPFAPALALSNLECISRIVWSGVAFT